MVLDGLVGVLVALTMRDVHEEATGERLADVLVVRLVLKCGRDEVTASGEVRTRLDEVEEERTGRASPSTA